jgi:hypothetical protein
MKSKNNKQKHIITTDTSGIQSSKEVVVEVTDIVNEGLDAVTKGTVFVIHSGDDEVMNKVFEALSSQDIKFMPLPKEIGDTFKQSQAQVTIQTTAEDKILSMLGNEENQKKMKELAIELGNIFGFNKYFAIKKIYDETTMSDKTNKIELLELFGFLSRDSKNPQHFVSITIDGQTVAKAALDNIMTARKDMTFNMERVRTHCTDEVQGVVKEILRDNGIVFQTVKELEEIQRQKSLQSTTTDEGSNTTETRSGDAGVPQETDRSEETIRSNKTD